MRPELRLDAERRVTLAGAIPAFSLVRAAEDRGFEPLRAVNPTRFPILGWAVLGCPPTFAERETGVDDRPRTGADENN